jgi:hypothetical protein
MLGWLSGLIFPACAFVGTGGLPAPAPIDLAVLARPSSPNTALAAPAGIGPVLPDIVLAPFLVPAGRLREAVRKVAADEGAFFHDETGAQDHFVARSKLFNFPDLVTAEVRARGDDGAELILYSRSLYGRSDLGANRARLERWLAALALELSG